MAKTETPECERLADHVTRYAWGELAHAEAPAVEAHLEACAECRSNVVFVRKMLEAYAERPPSSEPAEPCPDAELVVALEADELDQRTAGHVFAHVLHCTPCRDAYLILHSGRERHVEEKVFASLGAPRGTDVVIRVVEKATQMAGKAVQKVLELLEANGSGKVLQPVLATVRGKKEEAAQSLRIEDRVSDPDAKATSMVRIRIALERGKTAVRLEADPPRHNWTATLIDAAGLKRATVSLARSTILSSNVAGVNTIAIWSGRKLLASFTLDIQTA